MDCPLKKIPSCLLGLGYAALGVGAVLMALVAEHFFDLKPCFLCLTQRLPYIVIAVLGIAILLRHNHAKDVAVYLALICLTFILGGGVGIYQVGGEQHWWSLTAGCSADGLAKVLAAGGDVKAFFEAHKNAVPCDVVTWSFMGLSFAAINAIFSAVMAVISFYLALVHFKK